MTYVHPSAEDYLVALSSDMARLELPGPYRPPILSDVTEEITTILGATKNMDPARVPPLEPESLCTELGKEVLSALTAGVSTLHAVNHPKLQESRRRYATACSYAEDLFAANLRLQNTTLQGPAEPVVVFEGGVPMAVLKNSSDPTGLALEDLPKHGVRKGMIFLPLREPFPLPERPPVLPLSRLGGCIAIRYSRFVIPPDTRTALGARPLEVDGVEADMTTLSRRAYTVAQLRR